jgi:tRNA pseudouridine38-40 synthase
MRYFIKISYNGKDYNGWQIQGNTPTVQKELNSALSIILKSDIHTTGAGRTDTGVHASEFYAHFDLPHPNPLLKTGEGNLIYKINGILPPDIAVHDIFAVRDDANARFSAISRTYKYYIAREKLPFYNDFAYYLYGKLDVDKMNKAAEILMDYSDFTSFSKLHTNTKTNNCRIMQAEWTTVHRPESTDRDKALVANERQQIRRSEDASSNNEILVFTIRADRFLRNMVRAIVGTLLDVGRDKLSLREFKQIIESRNRSEAGFSVPAHALFLTKIEYPDNIFRN